MKKLLIAFVILFATAQCAFATTTILLTLANFTASTGNVFLGVAPPIMGPAIDNAGNSVNWTTTLTGLQEVGLQTGDDAEICYSSNGTLVLNEALYTGDTISIIYGQPQFPTGIACGCFGSACDVAQVKK